MASAAESTIKPVSPVRVTYGLPNMEEVLLLARSWANFRQEQTGPRKGPAELGLGLVQVPCSVCCPFLMLAARMPARL